VRRQEKRQREEEKMKCLKGSHIPVIEVDSTRSIFVEKCLICGIELSRGEPTPWAHLIEPKFFPSTEGSDGQGR
jgi:transcription elongation factor Elf1